MDLFRSFDNSYMRFGVLEMGRIVVLYDLQNAIGLESFLRRNQSVEIISVGVSKEDKSDEIEAFISNTESEYVYFYDPDYVYATDYLVTLKESLRTFNQTDIAMTAHRFADDKMHLIAPPYRIFGQGLYDMIYPGDALWDTYDRLHINMIGGIGCCLFRKSCLEKISADQILALIVSRSKNEKNQGFRKLFSGSMVRYVEVILAARVAKRAEVDRIASEYEKWYFTSKVLPLERGAVQQEITMFYMDKGEYYNLLPIANEAKRRGYHVVFTEDLLQEAEIGVYCQHVCYPKNSKFSVILLHDMLQDYSHWPNLWEVEPWGDFDLGILPGDAWSERWKTCGALYYANPTYGVFTLGYPKSDIIKTQEHKDAVSALLSNLQLKHNFSILYAPSWENDGKEDDFVRQLASLSINLLIKQAHWNAAYEHIIKNIEKMRELHEGMYPNVYYIDAEENIFTALEICDLVISDESNIMIEALLFGKPSIAVDDWKIPDCDPPRFAHFPNEYAIHCKRDEIRGQVERILAGEMPKAENYSADNKLFANIGNVCTDICDAIDYFTGYGTKQNFMEERLSPDYLPFD